MAATQLLARYKELEEGTQRNQPVVKIYPFGISCSIEFRCPSF